MQDLLAGKFSAQCCAWALPGVATRNLLLDIYVYVYLYTRVYGLGYGVQGLGFGVWGLGEIYIYIQIFTQDFQMFAFPLHDRSFMLCITYVHSYTYTYIYIYIYVFSEELQYIRKRDSTGLRFRGLRFLLDDAGCKLGCKQ